MEIQDLKANQGKVDVVVTVVEVSEPRTFEEFGKPGKVANAKIKDNSGEMKMTLWNDQIDQVKVGSKIHITNGWVSEWQGEKQLSTGRFGKMEVVGSEPIEKTKSEEGFVEATEESEEEHESANEDAKVSVDEEEIQ